jgi:hypothetical protein
MITQNRLTISTKDDTSKDSIDQEKNIFEYKDKEEKEKEIDKKIIFRSFNKENQKNDLNDNNSSNSNHNNSIDYKTYIEKNRLNINRFDSIETIKGNRDSNNEKDLINDKLNISLLKRESNNSNNKINDIKINEGIKEKEYKETIYGKNNFGDDLLSAEEIKGLNSLEKNIININTKTNYDDVNLLPEELDRIKKNQFKNNKSYLCSFIVFILSLLLTNSLNEYILLSLPLCFLKPITKENGNLLSISENEVIISIIVLEVFSFPFIIFFRIMKAFSIERRLLLIFYFILYIFILAFSTCKYLFLKDLETKTYSIKNILYRLGIIIIFILSNLIEGTTHLLSYKLIPSFVKICHINNKYIISYSTVIGKIIGGGIFSILCLMDKDNEYKLEQNPFSTKNIFKKGIYIFCCFTIASFIILCFCYKSLRVRAISKLFYISD